MWKKYIKWRLKIRNQWDKDLILWKDKQIHKHHCTNRKSTQTSKISDVRGHCDRQEKPEGLEGRHWKSIFQKDKKCRREIPTYIRQPKLNRKDLSLSTATQVADWSWISEILPTKTLPDLDRFPADSNRPLKKCTKALQIMPQNPKGRTLPVVVLLTGSRPSPPHVGLWACFWGGYFDCFS